MPRLVILDAAKRDLSDILEFISRSSESLAAGEKFVRGLDQKIETLASLTPVMGRSRPDLLPNLRSFPFKNHIFFFRYVDDTFELVNVLRGSRDIEAFFEEKAGG